MYKQFSIVDLQQTSSFKGLNINKEVFKALAFACLNVEEAFKANDKEAVVYWNKDRERLECSFDSGKLEYFLYSLGLDTKKPYAYKNCLHRALTTNIPVQGVRIEGYARSDKDWLNDKYVPIEDIAYGMKDKSFGKELSNLNPHSYVMSEDDRGCSGLDVNLVEGDCV